MQHRRRQARPESRARVVDLVHLDAKKRASFRRVGHRITEDRRHGSNGAACEFVHVTVDDASRLLTSTSCRTGSTIR